jgi:hypothetical protein
MKRLLACLLPISLFAADFDLPESGQKLFDFDQHLVVQNRVLLKVGGKPITVMDIVKRMDMVFFQQYPQLMENQMARYQFYEGSWRHFFNVVLDEQLVVQDAKEKQVAVKEGEVRRSMERVFGSDPIINLTKAGLTFQEAYDLLEADLLVQKMNGGMVFQRALPEVNPKRVYEYYERMVAENPPKELYRYQVLSFRAPTELEAKERALEAYHAIEKGEVTFDQIPSYLESEETKISLSEEFKREESEMSAAHRAALKELGEDRVSSPVIRKGVAYLFHMKEIEKNEIAPFAEMEKELQQKVLHERIVYHTNQYRERLRERYGFGKKELLAIIPEEFSPFAMQ